MFQSRGIIFYYLPRLSATPNHILVFIILAVDLRAFVFPQTLNLYLTVFPLLN